MIICRGWGHSVCSDAVGLLAFGAESSWPKIALFADATGDTSCQLDELPLASLLRRPDDGSARPASTGADFRPVVCNACAVTYDIACNGDALALRFVHTRFLEPILPADPCLCRLMCKEQHRMATNLALDPDLIELAVKVSGEKTKKAAVTRALEEFIARRSQKRLVDLMGKLEWDETFDYKVERSRR